jgi:alkylation response protein AidB-like acyl-CoA dehydrogenase
MWSSEVPVWRYGTDEQRTEWLPRLCRGEAVGIHAITEPEAGSDAFSLKTRAEKDAGGYVLTGRKTFITNAPVADLLIVFARLGEGTGPFGISAFIVPPDAEGLQITRLEKMGLRTSPMGEVALDGVRVPAENLLGREGKGARVFQTSMEWERGCIMATTVGTMQRVTEQTVAYAKERRQFGKSIGKFEAVAFKIADMKIRLDAARGLLYRTGHVMDSGQAFTAEAAEAKVFISEAAVQTHLDALQVHGGAGYLTETGLERSVRDALGGTIYSGTSEIQRRIIAKYLGL